MSQLPCIKNERTGRGGMSCGWVFFEDAKDYLGYAADYFTDNTDKDMLTTDVIIVSDTVYGLPTKRHKKKVPIGEKELARFTGAEVMHKIAELRKVKVESVDKTAHITEFVSQRDLAQGKTDVIPQTVIGRFLGGRGLSSMNED